MSRIGEEIKRLMDEQELTISKVVMNNPIDYTNLKNWLTGQTLPSTSKLEVLAPALKTSIQHLRDIIALDHRGRVAIRDKRDGLAKSPQTISDVKPAANKPAEAVKADAGFYRPGIAPVPSAPPTPHNQDKNKSYNDLTKCASILQCDYHIQLDNALKAKSHEEFLRFANLAWAENTAAQIITREIAQ